MVPTFTRDGLLPPGIHVATRGELRSRFGGNAVRGQILAGVERAASALTLAGCRRLWVDGSFVTSKEFPSDWDGCWDPDGVEFGRLDVVLTDFTIAGRARMKTKYLADLFPSNYIERASSSAFLDYFQVDKSSGLAKGVIQIELSSAP